MRITSLAIAGALLAATALPVAAQQQPSSTDLFKQAGNFLRNCDARADENGDRPEENYLCLAFVAGMIEGYNYAAVANGNPQPYCLVRPTSLVEMMDMMATVIERGAPETLPTAAVFHFILDRNFPCPDTADNAPEAAATDDAPATEGDNAAQ